MIDQVAVEQLERGQIGAAPVGGRKAKSYWVESLNQLRDNRIGVFAGYLILLLAAIAVLAPLISTFVTHFDPTKQDLQGSFLGPGRIHWLGADETGRDTLTRLVYGAQVTLTVGFLAVLVSLLVGGTVGLVAGFYGGWIDNVLMRFVDILLSIPSTLADFLHRPELSSLTRLVTGKDEFLFLPQWGGWLSLVVFGVVAYVLLRWPVGKGLPE